MSTVHADRVHRTCSFVPPLVQEETRLLKCVWHKKQTRKQKLKNTPEPEKARQTPRVASFSSSPAGGSGTAGRAWEAGLGQTQTDAGGSSAGTPARTGPPPAGCAVPAETLLLGGHGTRAHCWPPPHRTLHPADTPDVLTTSTVPAIKTNSLVMISTISRTCKRA